MCNNVVKTTIRDHHMFDCLYHPFMAIYGKLGDGLLLFQIHRGIQSKDVKDVP